MWREGWRRPLWPGIHVAVGEHATSRVFPAPFAYHVCVGFGVNVGIVYPRTSLDHLHWCLYPSPRGEGYMFLPRSGDWKPTPFSSPPPISFRYEGIQELLQGLARAPRTQPLLSR
jgi:hypothetical protein